MLSLLIKAIAERRVQRLYTVNVERLKHQAIIIFKTFSTMGPKAYLAL